MGFYSSGREALGGGTRAPFFKGDGEVLVAVQSIVSKTKRGTKHSQEIFNLKVVARAEDTEATLGKTYAYRFCEAEVQYPSDTARLVGIGLGLQGVDAALEPDKLADALDIDKDSLRERAEDDEEYEQLLLVKVDKVIQKRIEKLYADDGTNFAGHLVLIRLDQSESGYTSLYPSAVPRGAYTVENGEPTLKAGFAQALERKGWETWKGLSVEGAEDE